MLATLLLSSLSFYSCTGTGGAADSDGETYGSSSASGGAGGSSGSGSSAGGVTDSSGGEMSAWEIMQKMSAGHGDEVVAILTGGDTDPVAEERGTFEVILPASSMGLPAEGWVELEIAGDAYYKGKSFAGPDGNVRFTVPRQRVGAIITVSLTAYLPDGTEEGVPYTSGSKTGPAEEGGSYSFTVPLVDLPRVTISITGTKKTYGRTVEKDGVSYDVVEYTGSGLGMSVTNSDTEATMEIKLNDSTASESESLADGFNKIEVTAVKSEALPPVTVKKNIYIVKALSEDDIDIDYTNGTKNHKDGGTFGEDADGYEYVKYSYLSSTTYDALRLKVTNNTVDVPATGDSTMTVKVSGATTIAETEGNLPEKKLTDGQQKITIKLTRPHCESVELEEKINAGIKSVKVELPQDAGLKINIGNNTKLSGVAYLWKKGDDWSNIRNFSNAGWDNKNSYENCNHNYFSCVLEKTTDSMFYRADSLYAGNDPLKDVQREFSLADLWYDNIRSGCQGYIQVDGNHGISNASEWTYHRLWFSLSDNE